MTTITDNEATTAISAAQIDTYARDEEGRELVNRIIQRKAAK